MRYIGFDVGDGESAVAVFQQGSGIEPVMQPVCGSRSFLSAVGRLDGRVVIGEQAYASMADELDVRFKSRFTDDPRSYEPIVRFVRGVLDELRAQNALEDGDVFVVGCPAGWNAACRARYHDLLVRAGLPQPRVISESRAAFLYAKYAKTVALDVDVLRESALVIDIGSSTLDFAYIVDGRETGVGTFGDTHLGGGLLDAELLRRSAEKSREREKISAVFAECPSWRSYCEIEARRVKENYFTRVEEQPDFVAEKTVRVCYDGVQRLPIRLDAALCGELIDGPMPALNGRSFAQALLDALENARAVTQGNPPKLVLLTGGASRMSFFQQQCREVFAGAVVVCCPEPEFSIAKGLAYAGWVDENLRAFREAIGREVTDERVGEIARKSLPEVTPAVADALVRLVTDEAAVPVVNEWRRGDIDTLEHMNERLQKRVESVLASPLAEEKLAPVLEGWIAGLTAQLQALIDPICDRYSVPREEMRLELVQSGEAGKVKIGAKELLGFGPVGTLVSMIVTVVTALLCGGSGTALIAAGPAGLLAGAALGAVIAALGWTTLTSALMKANLPRPLRLMNVEKRLRGESTQRGLREALMKVIGGEDSEFAKQVVEGFTASFQRYLRSVAQAAEIPIQ